MLYYKPAMVVNDERLFAPESDMQMHVKVYWF
jgi:hypothetical protein